MIKIPKDLDSPHSPAKLIHEYHLQSQSILQKAKRASRSLTLDETKKLKELANAIKGLEVTFNDSATIEIFMRLVDYINKTDHDLALRVIPFQRSYLKEVFNLPIS